MPVPVVREDCYPPFNSLVWGSLRLAPNSLEVSLRQCSFFDLPFRCNIKFSAILAECSVNTGDSAQRSVCKSPSKQVSVKTPSQQLFVGRVIWSSLLTTYGATWFMLVLHCALLALDTYMLVYLRILWHKLIIVWLLVPQGKY